MKAQLQSAIALLGLIALLAIAETTLAPRALAHPLNVTSSLEECNIQFSSALTQGAFERFTREGADIVVYKNSGTDVLPAGRFELALSYMSTPIDQHSDAWNETFHHPDANHPLGDAISVPALYGRVGLGRRLDLGGYFTMNPNANYRFAGGGLKYALATGSNRWADLAASVDYGLIFGPDDVMVHALGTDLHVSHSWNLVTLYAAGGGTWAHAEETSPVVDLTTEDTFAPHAIVGVSPRLLGFMDLDLRARFSAVNTFEVKFGHRF